MHGSYCCHSSFSLWYLSCSLAFSSVHPWSSLLFSNVHCKLYWLRNDDNKVGAFWVHFTHCLYAVTSVTQLTGLHREEWLHIIRRVEICSVIFKRRIHWFVYYDHSELYFRRIHPTMHTALVLVGHLSCFGCCIRYR